jgi:hypothetical protein
VITAELGLAVAPRERCMGLLILTNFVVFILGVSVGFLLASFLLGVRGNDDRG